MPIRRPAAILGARIRTTKETRDDQSVGGNLASHRYSPLDQIDRDNVANLRVEWRYATGNFGPRPEQKMESTPLMLDGVLYTTVGMTRNVVAIDAVNTGEHAWMIASGPTPAEVASNPALAGVEIPPTGRATRAMLLATKTLLFGTDGWGGTPVLRAYDKATGQEIGAIDLPGPSGGLPMSYAVDGRQFMAISVAGERGTELVALALPN